MQFPCRKCIHEGDATGRSLRGDGREFEMEVLHGVKNCTNMLGFQCVVLIVAHHAEDKRELLFDSKEVHCTQGISDLKFVFLPRSSRRFVYISIDHALVLKIVQEGTCFGGFDSLPQCLVKFLFCDVLVARQPKMMNESRYAEVGLRLFECLVDLIPLVSCEINA